jgi:hypothetical protein
MARDTIMLAMGGGLDRQSGTLSADPARPRDQRNVLLFNGRARIRPGSVIVGTLPPAAGVTPTDVLGVYPYKYKGRLLVVAGAIVLGKWNVYLYEADSKGQNPVYRGVIWTALEPSQLPVVSIAESYQRVFFAHSYWPLMAGATTMRAVTRYWDGTTLADYPAMDFGGGPVVPRFAGVYSYLNYLVAWGYGNLTTPDRPEIVRVSLPGDPLTMRANDYAVAGQPAAAVYSCRQAGSTLQILKESEGYTLFGFDTRTFGIRPNDGVYGVAGPRLAVNVGGTCYSWTHQGPRIFTGDGPSVDAAGALAALQPLPSDLPSPGPAFFAHATYDPQTRRILWFWPNAGTGKTLVVSLSIWDERNPRWSYDTYPVVINTANPFTVSSLPPPAGTPAITGTTPGPYSCAVAVSNTGNLGDEVLEVWLRDVTNLGTWLLNQQPLSLPGTPQTVQIQGLTPGTSYEVAVRYERGGQYNAGSSSPDPSTWPPTQRATFATSAAPTPPTGFKGIGRCLDAQGLYGVTWQGVPSGTGSAQIAIKFWGGATVPTAVPAPPATPSSGSNIYNVDPTAPVTKSTNWKQALVGSYSVYYAWTRATSPDGAWSAGYTFWVPNAGSTPQFYDASGGPFPSVGSCPSINPAFRFYDPTPRDVVEPFAASTSDFAAVTDIALFLGLSGVPKVWRQDFTEIVDGRDPAVAGSGFAIVARVRTNRYAPNGANSEAVFTGLVVVSNQNTAGQITVQPILDDALLDPFTVGLMPTAGAEPVSDKHELVLMRRFLDSSSVERFKYRPRGGWFQLQIEMLQLSPGVFQVDSADLEYEIVRETMIAEGG